MSITIEIVQGDITTQDADAVVNAANSGLLGGGGVDGAIHAAAGEELLDECRTVRALSYPDGLPTGQAVITGAGALPARHVIHTVGPNRYAGQTDPALLQSCFTEALRLADEFGCRSVAFPAISAGVYGWQAEDVARTAVTAVRSAQCEHVELVRFVLFDERTYAAFLTATQE